MEFMSPLSTRSTSARHGPRTSSEVGALAMKVFGGKGECGGRSEMLSVTLASSTSARSRLRLRVRTLLATGAGFLQLSVM